MIKDDHDCEPTGFSKGVASDLLQVILKSSRDRIELLTLELGEQLRNYLRLFNWLIIAVVGGMHVLLLTSLLIVYLTTSDLRLPVAVCILILNWLLLVIAIFRLRKYMRQPERPFESTLEQIRKDLE